MKKENKYLIIAALLFELEGDRIHNDPDFHYEWNDWLNKYGDGSIEFASKFVTKKKDAMELAALIKKDHENNMWEEDKEGCLYNPTMTDSYGGFITSKYEEQLADFTGVGTQLEINIA